MHPVLNPAANPVLNYVLHPGSNPFWIPVFVPVAFCFESRFHFSFAFCFVSFPDCVSDYGLLYVLDSVSNCVMDLVWKSDLNSVLTIVFNSVGEFVLI